jgi:prepilin-type N-terminal cleavage/methylation domain-containing protein
MVRREAGYSLLEVVVAMAVFGSFLFILTILTAEMRAHEKREVINFMRHPQVVAVLSRMRRDVYDAHGSKPYRNEYGGFTASAKTLILETMRANGGVEMVVWDFSEEGVVTRHSYNVGLPTTWVARGLPPDFSSELVIDAVDIPGRPWGVRVVARDAKGNVAIDQILQPRAH